MRIAGVLLLSVVATFPGGASAQTLTSRSSQNPANQKASQPITLQARANLVVVDVVVTGKGNQPVQGLKQANFTLMEDGKPQSILNFEEHIVSTDSAAGKVPAMPKLPPGVFTNSTPAPAGSAANIVLFDALNSSLSDQDYLLQQFAEYLKASPPGTGIAAFGLSQRLVLLQSFSSDFASLLAAVKKQNGRSSPLLGDTVGGGDTGGGPGVTAGTLAAQIPLVPADLKASLDLFQTQIDTTKLQFRAKLTLDAVNQLARYLASIPGRKNLVWFSGDFPIDLVAGASITGFSPFRNAPASEQEYHDTINLLTRAQVAVYPVDIRGVNPVNLITTTSTAATAALGRTGDFDPISTQNAFEHEMMRRMASDTGGEAFVHTNDLSKVLNSAIVDGSNYYTLTYAPSDSNWDGHFRKIKVLLDPKEPHLAYRRGYYAAGPDSRVSALTAGPDNHKTRHQQPETAALLASMVHGIPGPTQVVFKIRVLPTGTKEMVVAPQNVPTPIGQTQSEQSFTRYVIDFDTEARDFVFPQTADGKYQCKVEFAGVVFDPAGHAVNSVSSKLIAALTPQQYVTVLQSGLPFRLQLSVPNQGVHSIRIGVEDLMSGRTGAIELPVSAVSGLSHVNVPRGGAASSQLGGP